MTELSRLLLSILYRDKLKAGNYDVATLIGVTSEIWGNLT